jgi:two-component system cell cycle response regulator
VEIPSRRDAFDATDLEVAAMASEFAASALHNVQRLRSVEQESLRVPLTEAYNMAYFHDHVEKELYKARRYGRHLAILKLRINNYRELKQRFLDRELETALQRLVETIKSVLRDADILAMAASSEFFILLPETDYWGALVAQKRIRKALNGQAILSGAKKSAALQVHLRAGAFPNDGSTFEALSAAADRRLDRLPKSLYFRRNLEKASFWSAAEGLLAEATEVFFEMATPVPDGGGNLSSGRFLNLSPGRLAETMRAFCREVVESRRVRGLIYCGCGDFSEALQAFGDPEGVERSATSLFLLGGRERTHLNFQRIVPIFIEDDRFRTTTFLFYLNEDTAYALLAREQGEALFGYHTSDFFFVENMIDKLQQHYRLRDPL